MKIAIFGSTGGSGRELVRQALEQGHEVTAFVETLKSSTNLKMREVDEVEFFGRPRIYVATDSVDNCHSGTAKDQSNPLDQKAAVKTENQIPILEQENGPTKFTVCDENSLLEKFDFNF